MKRSPRPFDARFAGAAIVGVSLSVAPALTLLACAVVASLVRRELAWYVRARRFSVMAVGAALLVIPQVALGRFAPEQFVPLAWILAFGVGVRAAHVRHALTAEDRAGIALGVVAGLAGTLLVAAVGVAIGGAPAWRWSGMHENLWAARIAVLALAVPVLVPARPWTWSWTLAAAGAILAGSRSALAGVAVGAAAGWWTGRGARPPAIRRAAPWIVLATVVLGFVPSVRSHVLDGVRGLLPPSPSVNLVPASEDVGRAPWVLEGVRVELEGRDADGFAIARVTKTDGALGSRPIVPVDLKADEPYVLTANLVPEPETLPGIRFWAPATASAPAFVATVAIDGGVPVLHEAPGIALDQASIVVNADGRLGLRVRLQLAGDEVRRVWIGPAPDLREGTVGASVAVARLQVAAADRAVHGYVATYAETGSVQTARSRYRIFSIAQRGIAEAPWFGHGVASFEGYQREGGADAFAFAHAHNLVLQVLFETGWIGLAGFVLLFGAMLWPGARGRIRPEVVALVLAVVVMNVFDYTFVAADLTLVFAAALGVASVPTSPPGERATAAA